MSSKAISWKRRAFVLAVLLPVFLLSLIQAGCGGKGKGSNSAITVGVVLPITGREAKPGQYQKEGIELAVQQINQKGGIHVHELDKKLPVKIVFYDDGSDQAKSASLVERAMTSDGVVAVLGGYSTALGQAESVMPDRYQTPWITTGAAASTIFSRGYQYAFGTLSRTDLLGYTTAQFLGDVVDKGKLRRGLRLALALENTDHGVDYGNGIQQWITEHPANAKLPTRGLLYRNSRSSPEAKKAPARLRRISLRTCSLDKLDRIFPTLSRPNPNNVINCVHEYLAVAGIAGVRVTNDYLCDLLYEAVRHYDFELQLLGTKDFRPLRIGRSAGGPSFSKPHHLGDSDSRQLRYFTQSGNYVVRHEGLNDGFDFFHSAASSGLDFDFGALLFKPAVDRGQHKKCQQS